MGGEESAFRIQAAIVIQLAFSHWKESFTAAMPAMQIRARRDSNCYNLVSQEQPAR
jgi:hypothetical protein